jgi:hypothetical protein
MARLYRVSGLLKRGPLLRRVSILQSSICNLKSEILFAVDPLKKRVIT